MEVAEFLFYYCVIKISAHSVGRVDKQFVWLHNCLKSPARQKCYFLLRNNKIVMLHNTWKAFSHIHQEKLTMTGRKLSASHPSFPTMHL